MTHHPLRSHCVINRANGLYRVGAILGCGFFALILGACATKSQPSPSTSRSTEPTPPPKPNASRSPPLALRDCEARVLFAAYASERPEKEDRKCRKSLYRKLNALDLKALEELDEYRREDRKRRKAERKAGKDFFPSDPQQDERVLNRLTTLGQRHPGDVSLELLITRFLFIVDPEVSSAGRQRLEKLVQRVPNDSRVRMLAAEMELMTGHVVKSLEHSVACLRHSPEVESCRLVYDQAVKAFKMPYCSSTPPTLALQIASRPKGHEEYAPKTDETIVWPPKNRPLYESNQPGDTPEVVDVESLPPAEPAAGDIIARTEDVIEVPDGRGLFVLAKEKVRIEH